jgi:hypothetical protein
MFILDEFRAGIYGVPFSLADDLPPACFRCVYLMAEENPVCYCEKPFYYYCCYSWPDKLTDATPLCLEEDSAP